MRIHCYRLSLAALFLLFPLFIYAEQTQNDTADIPGLSGLELTIGDDDYTISITDAFTYQNVQFTPGTDGLTLSFDASATTFSIYGSASMEAADHTFDISVGSSGQPGIVFSDSALEQFSVSVSSEFVVGGQTITPSGITVNYSDTGNEYQFSGGLTTVIEGQTLNATLGEQQDGGGHSPGIVLQNGSLQGLTATLSSNLTLNGVDLQTNDLLLSYDSSASSFKLTGSATVTTSETSVIVIMGDADTPGLEIENGSLQDGTISVDSTPFSLGALSVTPKTLKLNFSSSNSQFEFYGGADLEFDNETFSLELGSSGSPGMTINGGELTQFDGTVSGEITLKSQDFTAKSLELSYTQADNSFGITGTVDYSMDGNQIELTFSEGAGSEAGIYIVNGELQHFKATVTSDITYQQATFSSHDLSFEYDHSSDYYAITGGAYMSMGSDSLSVNFNDPGIILQVGHLADISIEIDAQFDHAGLKITPDHLFGEYSHHNHEYIFGGTLNVELDGESISAKLGKQNDAGDYTRHGLLIKDNEVQRLELYLDSDIKLNGIELHSKNLLVEYIKSHNKVEIKGDAAVKFDGTELYLAVKDVEVIDGEIQDFDLEVSTTPFKIGSVKVHSTSLEFKYHQHDKSFIISGEAIMDIDGNPFSLIIGKHDMVDFEIRDGELIVFQADVTGSFKLKGASFEAKGLEFYYSRHNEVYEFNGGAKMQVKKEFVEIDFIKSDKKPGLIIEKGVVEHIEMSVTSDLKVSGIELKTKGLGFSYDKSADEFHLFGESEFIFEETEKIDIKIGTESEPGLVMKDGELISLDFTITSDFKAKQLEFQTQDLEIVWYSYADRFNIYGEAKLQFEHDLLDISMPKAVGGIEIEKGKITAFNATINSDIKLGGFEFKTKELAIRYNALKELIKLNGIVEFTEVFEVQLEFGMPNSKMPGLVVDFSGSKPKIDINDLTIEIDHLNLGTIDLKKLKIEFGSDGLKEAAVAVVLPGGNEVGGDLVFTGTPKKLEKISIDYRADNLAEAIEIFEGVFMAYMLAEVTNIDNPHDLKVEGAVQVFAGEGLTFDGISLAMVQSGAQTTIDRNEFKLSTFISLGAKRVGSGNHWDNYFGRSYTDFSINFPHKRVSTSISTVMPASFDFIELDASVLLSPTNFAVWAEATFYIPRQIPLAGGKTLFHADGAVHYYFKSKGGGYMAGWGNIGGLFVGARYNFYDKKTHSIGKKSVTAIENDYRWAEHHKTSATDEVEENISVHTFEITRDGVNFALLQADWFKTIDSVYVEVIGPEGFYDITHWNIVNQNDENTLPDIEFIESVNYILNDSLAYLQINTPSLIREHEAKRPSMIKGRYQVAFYYPDVRPDSLNLQVHQVWQSPEIEMDVTYNDDNNYEIDLNFWSSLPDTTEIMIFVSDTPGYEDGKVIANIFPDSFDADNYGSYSFEYSPDFSPLSDTLYFYTQIFDNINPPVRTDLSPPHAHSHDISGMISFPADSDSLKSGVRVFVDLNDNGSFDIEATGGLEPFGISQQDGTYHIHDTQQGTFPLRAVLPRGYRIKGTESRSDAVMVSFTGEPKEVNLEIEAYTPN